MKLIQLLEAMLRQVAVKFNVSGVERTLGVKQEMYWAQSCSYFTLLPSW